MLLSTSNKLVNLNTIKNKVVVFCYPRTGKPEEEPPHGWDEIPGARGCTPQLCGINSKENLYEKFGVTVFGLSTQSNTYQKEVIERLNLKFDILSDSNLDFTKALHLPTFNVANMTLLKRLTLIIENGIITKFFYPVFPSTKAADDVLEYLTTQKS
nr:peroxiredoxin [Pigmentibacter ruber]